MANSVFRSVNLSNKEIESIASGDPRDMYPDSNSAEFFYKLVMDCHDWVAKRDYIILIGNQDNMTHLKVLTLGLQSITYQIFFRVSEVETGWFWMNCGPKTHDRGPFLAYADAENSLLAHVTRIDNEEV